MAYCTGIDVADEVAARHQVKQVAKMSVGRGPGGEGQQRRAGLDARRRAARPRPRSRRPRCDPCPAGRASSSLADSKADTTKRQPAAGHAGPHVAVAQDVLDLGGHVEGQVGEGAVDGVDHARRVVGTVQEVGVAEGDVAGPHAHELGDVGHDGVLADQAGAAVVDDGDRTVTAAVRAPVARLHVAGQAALAPESQAGVAVQAGQEVAGREAEPAPPELDHGRSHLAGGAGTTGAAPSSGEAERRPRPPAPGSYSPAMARSASPVEVPSRPVEARVQAVETQRAGRAARARIVGARRRARRMAVCMGTEHATASAQSTQVGVERIDGQIDAAHVVAGAQQRAGR